MAGKGAMNGLDDRQRQALAEELSRLKREALAGVRRASGEIIY